MLMQSCFFTTERIVVQLHDNGPMQRTADTCSFVD